jgi:hypothetical protein
MDPRRMGRRSGGLGGLCRDSVAITPISPPPSNSFSPEVVENGAVLAAVGR